MMPQTEVGAVRLARDARHDPFRSQDPARDACYDPSDFKTRLVNASHDQLPISRPGS